MIPACRVAIIFYFVMFYDKLEDCGNWLCISVVTMALNIRLMGFYEVDINRKSRVRVWY